MTEHDDDVTKEELYEEAQELDVEGRSKMNKAELAEAVAAAEAESDGDGPTEDDASPQETTEADTTAEIVADPPAGIDPDSVEDPDASFAEEGANVTDTGWVIKSRREEEDEQHARREAANAKVEETVKAAKTNPW